MIELSVSAGALRFAAGIADADRIGVSAKVQVANPINKSRFMFPPQKRYASGVNVPSSIEFHSFRHHIGGHQVGAAGRRFLTSSCRPRRQPEAAFDGMAAKSPGFASGAFVAVSGSATSYFFPVLRASFTLSLGAYSDAPLDMPVVAVVGESFILSPGESSEAPRGVGEVELFIWVPGAEPEAPLDEPAKLKPDDPSSMAAAAITKVFFISFSNVVQHGWRNSTLAG